MNYKRRWTWKEKHVRRHWSHNVFGHYGPPKDFRESYHRGNRAKERMDLRKILMGHEDVDTNPKYHPSAAKWDWD